MQERHWELTSYFLFCLLGMSAETSLNILNASQLKWIKTFSLHHLWCYETSKITIKICIHYKSIYHFCNENAFRQLLEISFPYFYLYLFQWHLFTYHSCSFIISFNHILYFYCTMVFLIWFIPVIFQFLLIF